MKRLGMAAATLHFLSVSAHAEQPHPASSLVDSSAHASGGEAQVEPRLFRHLDELVNDTDAARDEVEQLRNRAIQSNENNRVIDCLRAPDRQTSRAHRLAHQLTGLARDSARHGQVDDAHQLEHRIAFQVAVLRWGLDSARQCMKLTRHQTWTQVRVFVDPKLADDWMAYGR